MSFNIENVAATLVPFDLYVSTQAIQGQISPYLSSSLPSIFGPTNVTGLSLFGNQNASVGQNMADTHGVTYNAQNLPGGVSQAAAGAPILFTKDGTSSSKIPVDPGGPMSPIVTTGGLVFPYPPTISESISVKYDNTELVHSNENVHTFRSVDNIRLSLSNCVWTSETFNQAVYTLGVIHFFRSMALMSFGRRAGTGKPPSPMWFSAYGTFMYNRLPVLMEKVDWSMPNHQDMDYVGVPDPGTQAYANQQLIVPDETFQPGTGGAIGTTGVSQDTSCTWIPMRLEVSISLIVQHTISYWTQQFSLADYWNGRAMSPFSSSFIGPINAGESGPFDTSRANWTANAKL